MASLSWRSSGRTVSPGRVSSVPNTYSMSSEWNANVPGWYLLGRAASSKWYRYTGASPVFRCASSHFQVPNAIWYSAYPDETLWNLQKDVRLRDTIGQNLSEAQAHQLLQLL